MEVQEEVLLLVESVRVIRQVPVVEEEIQGEQVHLCCIQREISVDFQEQEVFWWSLSKELSTDQVPLRPAGPQEARTIRNMVSPVVEGAVAVLPCSWRNRTSRPLHWTRLEVREVHRTDKLSVERHREEREETAVTDQLSL